VLNRLQHLIEDPFEFTDEGLRHVIDFVRHGLADPGAAPEALRHLIPESVPSGLPVHSFDFGARLGGDC
jgi:hypothetical protein